MSVGPLYVDSHADMIEFKGCLEKVLAEKCTPRERIIYTMLSRGYKQVQIAQMIGKHESTVSRNKTRLLQKIRRYL